MENYNDHQSVDQTAYKSRTNILQASLQPGVKLRELFAWALYDFANSGYTTVVITAVFSAYFVGVVAEGKQWATLAFTVSMSLSYFMVMISMPGIGVLIDARKRKKRVLAVSTVGCVLATLVLMKAQPGTVFLALLALMVSNYFYCVGESVIASFLPEIALSNSLGRVSGWGWGFGYFGGMLTLGLSLLVVFKAAEKGLEAVTYVPWVMLLTALVFAVAAIPALAFLQERTPPNSNKSGSVFAELRKAWVVTRKSYPNFYRLLLCGACYHAGIAVVVTLSSVYATLVMGFTMASTMLLILIVNIAAATGALLFGHVQDKIGHKRALTITLYGWILMVLVAFVALKAWVFWIAAVLAGLCMGTSQSAGRAMVAALAPKGSPAEFYGLWTFAIQLAAVVGPVSYGFITMITAGQHRLALLFTGVFFVAGLVVLRGIEFNSTQRESKYIAIGN